MVMDMGRDAAQDQNAVELVYEPTVRDYTQALRARLRASRSGRLQRWLPGLLAVLAALDAALLISGGDQDHWSASVIVWAPLLAVLIAITPWLQARQVHRLAARQGTFRAVVTETGVSMTSEAASATLSWAATPRYAETEEVFVLLSGDRKAVGVTVLPKRGVQDPAGADRLRAILDDRLTRL